MKCSQCGSKNLYQGKMGVHRHTFVPGGGFGIRMIGYAIEAYACLDCGNVEQRIKPEDLEKLRKDAQ